MELFFPIPWAQSGDKEVIPTNAPSNGKVSFELGFGIDYEKDLSKDANAKNIERKKLNYILNQLCVAINTLSQEDGLPVGMPIPWPSLNLPTGNYKIYDGSSFNKTDNPKLTALFPNGILPDIRGLVIRGLDKGRLLDPNRVLLSYQEDAIQNITGRIVVDGNVSQASGAFQMGGDSGRQGASNVGTSRYCTFDASRVVRTATETRMKNIAFLYITKAG